MAERLEYRVCWSAASNVTFRGGGEWYPANEDETTEQIEEGLSKGGSLADGLELVIGESGFEWWVETRESKQDGGES